jgi:hypothetical protein
MACTRFSPAGVSRYSVIFLPTKLIRGRASRRTTSPIAGFSYTGFIPNHVTNGVDYAWVVGLLVSGLVYLVLSRSLDLEAEQAAIAASERELQRIDVATGAVRDGE